MLMNMLQTCKLFIHSYSRAAMAASSELLYDGEPLIAHSDGSAACLLCKCLLTDYFQGEPPKARAARMLLYASLAVVEWVTKRTT